MPASINGSFRGVRFGLFAHSLDSGRRVVVHEFPFKDTPYVEDLGLRTRGFTLDVFVLGDDVAAQRDRLRAALEQKGPGTLVHPYLGTLTVQVESFTLTENNLDQRIANFSVSFLQPGKLEFPSTAVNPVGTISAASTAASLHAGSQAANIDVSKPVARAAISSVLESTSENIRTAARRAAKPNTAAAKAGESRSTVAETITAMSAYVRDLGSLSSLIETPDLMSYALADVVFRLSGLGMDSFQAFVAYRRLLADLQATFSGLHFPTTSIGATIANNVSLFRDVVYTAVVSSAATMAVDASFTTYAEAIATRDQLAAMFDVAMADVTDDTLFGYLQDLRAQSLIQIPRPGEDLPNIVEVLAPVPLPSLVLAYDLMNGRKDEARLIELNDARNPWLIPNASGSPVLILK